MTTLASRMAAVTLLTLLSACSGSGGSAPAVSNNPPSGSNPPGNETPTIEGIATPSSVSVVTATNAD